MNIKNEFSPQPQAKPSRSQPIWQKRGKALTSASNPGIKKSGYNGQKKVMQENGVEVL